MKKLLSSVLAITFILPGVCFATNEEPVVADYTQSSIKVKEPRPGTVKPT